MISTKNVSVIPTTDVRMKERDMIHGWLKEADIEPNGSRSWDIQIHNDKLYQRVLAQGSLGFGEAYMDGWWDAERLDELLSKLLSSGIDKKVMNWRTALYAGKAMLVNLGSRGRAYHIGEAHYDIGNDLYERMLDKRMTYTCGYWNGGAQTLDEAQEAKLDLICKKLRLEPGMRMLDIGGGWGSLAIYAAEKYGAQTVNVTVSKEQLALGQKKAEELGVADRVEMRYQDYREVNDGPYDRIASVGMFEHVGYKNYRDFMEVAHRLLKDEGLFLLHTIGGNKSVKTTDRWIGKYIFPNSMLPSVAQVGASMERLFVMEDWHNFGPNYDTTLMEWYKNFHDAWPELEQTGKYDERFMRMWDFYLMSSAASFRVRNIQLWQVLLSKGRVPGGLARVS